MLQQVQLNKLECYHCGLPVAAGEQFCAQLNGDTLRHFCCPACRAIATTIVESGLGSFYQHQMPSKQAASAESFDDTFTAFDDAEFQQRFVSLQNEAPQHKPDQDSTLDQAAEHSIANNTDQTSVATNATTIATIDLLIGGMHCAACVWLLEKYLAEVPGVQRVSVNFSEQKATIQWQPGTVLLSHICQAISRLGYQPEPYSANDLIDMQRRENHQALRRLGVAGIAMMQVGMFAIALYAGALQGITQEYRDFMRWISLLVATPVILYCAKPFFIGAWRGLRLKKPGMDLPVAIAITLAYTASCRATITGSGDVYFDAVTLFTFLLLGGRYLEMRARHYSGGLNRDLSSLLPSTAIRLVPSQPDGGSGNRTSSGEGPVNEELSNEEPGSEEPSNEQQCIPLFKVKRGDQLLVKAGQTIPADGEIIAGHSHVNEAQLTGEFLPQPKTVGDNVVAGTLNGNGVLTMLVRSTGAQLQLQSINTLLQSAQSKKPKVAQLADRYASYFISVVLMLAAITYIFWRTFDGGQYADNAFWVMLSVLVVSCPCALSLATPAALTAATNRLRSMGILVTEPQVWETMSTITHVVCDKTGTLTQGELSLATVKPAAQLNERQCIDIAAALESFSEHPIAQAFDIGPTAVAVSAVTIAAGEGVQGCINGETYRIGRSEYAATLYGKCNERAPGNEQWILLSNEAGPLCWFELKDRLRADAGQLIAGLRTQNLAIHLLSGDSSGAAQQLSQQLKLDHCVAGASPQDKLDYIQALQQQGGKVLMLGDGINDIPVLAAADISVAMSNASNLAKTHADSILLSGKLCAVLTLIALASRTRRTIRQNIAWALGYNLLAIPLAMMALVPPYVAAIGMSVSSLVVVVNALRLQRYKQPALAFASPVATTAELV